MFEFRRVKESEREEIRNLQEVVYNGLENKDFFMPFSEEGIDLMFDNDKIIAYGAYHRGKLVALAQLYVDDMFVSDKKELLNLEDIKVGALGGSLVLSEYRQNGLMTSLSTILIQEARRRDIEQLIITVHPDNFPSNITFSKMGAEKILTTYVGDFWRNIYILDISRKKQKCSLNKN